MEIVLFIIAFLLLLAGIIFSILPGLPGAPLSYLGVLILHFGTRVDFSNSSLVLMAILAGLSQVIIFILPLLDAKIYGISKKGMWMATVGLLAGLIFFPPFGFILGIFLGAILGELWAGKSDSQALKAGVATFLASIFSLIFELIVATLIFFWAIVALF